MDMQRNESEQKVGMMVKINKDSYQNNEQAGTKKCPYSSGHHRYQQLQ